MEKPKNLARLFLFIAPVGIALVAFLLLLRGLGRPLPTPTPTPNPAQQVVARLGEEDITFADWAVAFYLDALMSRLSGQPLPAASETLERLVNDTLVLAAAKEEGIAVSKADVEGRIALLETSWGLTDGQVIDELAAIGLTRQIWADAVAHLLTVERYLEKVVWAGVPAAGHEIALGDWLQARRTQTNVEIDARGLQPVLPTPLPVPSATRLAALPTATAAALPSPTPTATPLAASPLITPVQVSPLPVPTLTPSPTPHPETPSSPDETQDKGPVTDTPTPLTPSPISTIGQPAPDFSLPGTDGQPVSLSDYRDQRKVVIVFFRTTG
ncbi:MAG: redoxin domain-containing protein [Anaerolineae bacterium]|nr:MAG: redoxin domain-containing protein [Anaerolineae bacterium]